MQTWINPNSPRIWRCSGSYFYGDEPMDAASVYTDVVLERIAADGFNGVWLRGKLYDLMQSTILPELNPLDVTQRVESIQTLIHRAAKHGIGVYLYFNEPLSLKIDDPFWKTHQELQGEPCREFVEEPVDVVSLCTSHPTVQTFFRQAIDSMFQPLAGLAGVILITASEYHSHCWSRRFTIPINDGFEREPPGEMICPRCRDREPAEIVGELVRTWLDAASQISPAPRIMAWNWSWSCWYPTPQKPMLDHLPQGAEVIADFDRGGNRPWFDKILDIDEYSLGDIGPSDRFIQFKQAADTANVSVIAKVQLNTTHELGTVPNLPLLHNLHAKLVAMSQHDVAGIMGCWNFGSSHTLNTFAVRSYCQAPSTESIPFLERVAHEYFGNVDIPIVVNAWHQFSQAFTLYPFSMATLYFGVINHAPAFPLQRHYQAKPMRISCFVSQGGDRLEDGLKPFSIEELILGYDAAASQWHQVLPIYLAALNLKTIGSDIEKQHRIEERACAEMIGLHLLLTANIYRFHQWRLNQMERQGLTAPCEIDLDSTAIDLIHQQLAWLERSRELASGDSRLGWHEECHGRYYNAVMIQQTIDLMKCQLH